MDLSAYACPKNALCGDTNAKAQGRTCVTGGDLFLVVVLSAVGALWFQCLCAKRLCDARSVTAQKSRSGKAGRLLDKAGGRRRSPPPSSASVRSRATAVRLGLL